MWKKNFKRLGLYYFSKRLSRSEPLQEWMVGKKMLVHDGKTWQPLQIVKLRLGNNGGQFVFTRKMPVHKRKRRNKMKK